MHKAGQLLSLLLSVLLVACSSDISEEVQGHDEPVAFSLAFCQVKTRATTLDNIWPNGSVITISNGSNVYNYRTKSNSAGAEAGTMVQLEPASTNYFFWPSTNQNWQFKAWYPATSNPTSTSTRTSGITVNANQTVYDATNNTSGITDAVYQGYDLLYSEYNSTSTYRATVPLQFHHQMTRVIVQVNSDFTEGHEEVIDNVTVRRKEVVKSVSFGGERLKLIGTITEFSTTGENGSTTWSVSGSSTSINMRPLTALSNPSNNLYVFECILPPQSDSDTNGLLVTITTSGAEDHEHNLIERTYKYYNSFSLQSGYQYTYDLAVSEQGTITLDRVKVEGWDSTVAEVDNEAVIPGKSYPTNPVTQ